MALFHVNLKSDGTQPRTRRTTRAKYFGSEKLTVPQLVGFSLGVLSVVLLNL